MQGHLAQPLGALLQLEQARVALVANQARSSRAVADYTTRNRGGPVWGRLLISGSLRANPGSPLGSRGERTAWLRYTDVVPGAGAVEAATSARTEGGVHNDNGAPCTALRNPTTEESTRTSSRGLGWAG